MPEPRTYVGTAAWSVPKPGDDPAFAGPGSQLERYARRLGCAEINSCFYRPHRPATYASWARSTPAGFRFTLKLPRAISHADDFAAAAREHLPGFVAASAELGPKLGCLLVQLPPRRAYSPAYLAAVGDALGAPFAGRLALEPRHRSWFAGEADEALAGLGVARVAVDPPIAPGNEEPAGSAALVYCRLHGSPKIYYSAYGRARLEDWRRRVARAAKAAAEVYCIFDNTAQGAALRDARLFRAMLDER